MVGTFLHIAFQEQLDVIDARIKAEQEKLHSEEDKEKSLFSRERIRLLEICRGELVAAQTNVFVADAAVRDGEVRFLEWRIAVTEVETLHHERAGLAAALERARADVARSSELVAHAELSVAQFPDLDPDQYHTEPERERHRIELGKLQAIVSEKSAAFRALKLLEGEALRNFLDIERRTAAAEFSEGRQRPSQPQPERGFGELRAVR